MARIRTVKPEFWMHEGLGKMSSDARLTAIGLLNLADDEGFFWFNPAYILSQLFMHQIADSGNSPGTLPEHSRNGTGTLPERSRTCPVRFPDMSRILSDLVEIGYVETFEGTDGKHYGHVVNFKKHQVISKPRPSKIKHLQKDSRNTPGIVPEHSRNTPGHVQSRNRGTGEIGKHTPKPLSPSGSARANGRNGASGGESERGKSESVLLIDRFWSLWPDGPRKVARERVEKALAATIAEGTNSDAILDGLKRWLVSAEWQRDDGRYVPKPEKWVRERQFDADPKPAKTVEKTEQVQEPERPKSAFDLLSEAARSCAGDREITISHFAIDMQLRRIHRMDRREDQNIDAVALDVTKDADALAKIAQSDKPNEAAAQEIFERYEALNQNDLQDESGFL